MDDDALVEAFESATVTPAQWDHRAHVRVAFAVLRDSDVDGALARMRPGLRRLLEAFGVEDGPVRGFHETLTVAWLRVVSSAIESYGPYADSAELLEGHPYLLDKRLMRLFYSRDRITSAEAKAGFVEPDLTPLP